MFTGISVRTLQRLRQAGSLPYSRVGRQVFYTKEDWLECLRRTRRPGVAQKAA